MSELNWMTCLQKGNLFIDRKQSLKEIRNHKNIIERYDQLTTYLYNLYKTIKN